MCVHLNVGVCCKYGFCKAFFEDLVGLVADGFGKKECYHGSLEGLS